LLQSAAERRRLIAVWGVVVVVAENERFIRRHSSSADENCYAMTSVSEAAGCRGCCRWRRRMRAINDVFTESLKSSEN